MSCNSCAPFVHIFVQSWCMHCLCGDAQIVPACLCGNAHVAFGRARIAHHFKRIDVLPFSAMRIFKGRVEVFPSPAARMCNGGLRNIWEATPNGVAPIRGVWEILLHLEPMAIQYIVLLLIAATRLFVCLASAICRHAHQLHSDGMNRT